MTDHKTRRCLGSYVPRRGEIRPECRDCLRYVVTHAPEAVYLAAALVNGQCVNKVIQQTEGMGL
jgi:hypothetical protein